MKLKVHHIGYLVKDLDKAAEAFQLLGYRVVQPKVHDDLRNIDIIFLSCDHSNVELIMPASNDSTVQGLMKHYKNSPYHICYISDHYEEDCRTLLENGFIMIDKPLIAPACGDHEVVFFMHPSIGMIELLDGDFDWNEKA